MHLVRNRVSFNWINSPRFSTIQKTLFKVDLANFPYKMNSNQLRLATLFHGVNSNSTT